MPTRVRRATGKDEQFYFEVRTDPTVAAMSSAPPPNRTQHAIWFAQQGAYPRKGPSGTAYLYIIEGLQDLTWASLGTLRLNLATAPATLKTVAWVSLALLPTARRQGHGVAALQWAVEEARAVGASELCAWIKAENQASQQCFSRAGYTLVGNCGPDGMLMGIYAIPDPRPRWRQPVVQEAG